LESKALISAKQKTLKIFYCFIKKVSEPGDTFISYIMAVSFIGGGNLSTLRKPLTCRKSIMGFELTNLVVIGTDCTDSYKSNYPKLHCLEIKTRELNKVCAIISILLLTKTYTQI
jgi:hypothetical protein